MQAKPSRELSMPMHHVGGLKIRQLTLERSPDMTS
eukprot:CAMPEP_0194772656 /NCGR_PEP_ID=MMETSP0323_2-20130528/52644_1 /TAXON_ID=2866 ORGANISM="Crypthecodinium cohnii, Strain Seligo" /NCGR_SAMPLE_ID=MMETSP0323_2 /ASSEMBLY_ACC=CAM_ASM_000346 /LENGTH=34 /DNA_ID= /DNA_START= /DNA_END= /DNA_ORIENTATION=